MMISSAFTVAHAQDESQLALRLSRNFGYSSGTGDIQGTFTMKVDSPEDLTRVVFYIDDQVIGEVAEPPFQLRFRTGDFPLGVHTLRAVGYTSQGKELSSNQQRLRPYPKGPLANPALGYHINSYPNSSWSRPERPAPTGSSPQLRSLRRNDLP